MASSMKSKIAVVAALALAVGGLVYWRSDAKKDAPPPPKQTDTTATPSADDTAPEDGKNPRMVIGRVWLDKMPKKRTDEIDLWIFFGGGIGIEDKGSSFRYSLDVFEFERQGSKIDLEFLHDKQKANVKFVVKSCNEGNGFDLCLTLDPPIRGVSKLYSWGDDDEMDKAVPWARTWRTAAEAHAKSAREAR
jgi:hypothetical protein